MLIKCTYSSNMSLPVIINLDQVRCITPRENGGTYFDFIGIDEFVSAIEDFDLISSMLQAAQDIPYLDAIKVAAVRKEEGLE